MLKGSLHLRSIHFSSRSLCLLLMVLSLRHFLLQGFHGITLGYTHKKWWKYCEKWKRKLEREVKIQHTLSPPHTGPIPAWSRRDCGIVCFGKLRELAPDFTMEKGVSDTYFAMIEQALRLKHTEALSFQSPDLSYSTNSKSNFSFILTNIFCELPQNFV